jgi:hypothetical protein
VRNLTNRTLTFLFAGIVERAQATVLCLSCGLEAPTAPGYFQSPSCQETHSDTALAGVGCLP